MKLGILRKYYQVTENETNRTGYRQRLHDLFQSSYSKFQTTEQQVADQLRLILNNKTPITLSQRDTMREEVEAAARNTNTASLIPVDEQETSTPRMFRR